MNSEPETLSRKLAALLSWERRKRREQIFASSLFFTLLAALLSSPLHSRLPTGGMRWLMPVLYLVVLAPYFFLKHRWRRADSTRALARLDKALGLDERAITAWELLERNDTRAAALLVLKEAGERLKSLDPRALFRRRWNWHGYLALPLLVLWLGILWFDIDLQLGSGVQPAGPKTMAQRLREFSRDLQEKAHSEGLRESLQIGRELEKMAQQQLDARAAEEPFKREIGAMAKRIEAAGRTSAVESRFHSATESEQSLKDLKAELEAARDSLNFPDGQSGSREIQRQLSERLGGLPQLQREIHQGGLPRLENLRGSELKSFLDKLEKQVTGELDRRTLLDAQQFLEQLLKEGQGEKGQSNVRTAGPSERDAPGEGERAKTRSSLPGDEPGRKEDSSQTMSQSQGGAATHLKGVLGEGKSIEILMKGKPAAGKSEVSQEEVIASYRRQAEAELNTERVPEGLKETIKNYFLSLGPGEGGK